jgi:hypothetical protein
MTNSVFVAQKKLSLQTMRKIKLIWDFRGQDALKIAEHHEIHLKQYITAEKIDMNITGFEAINDIYAIAYMVVTDENMIAVRDTLKPHRGELYVLEN